MDKMKEVELANPGKPVIVHTDMHVVDENLDVLDFRKRVCVSDVTSDVGVAVADDGCFLSVDSDHFMSIVNENLRQSLSDALGCACYQCFHIFFLRNEITAYAIGVPNNASIASFITY